MGSIAGPAPKLMMFSREGILGEAIANPWSARAPPFSRLWLGGIGIFILRSDTSRPEPWNIFQVVSSF